MKPFVRYINVLYSAEEFCVANFLAVFAIHCGDPYLGYLHSCVKNMLHVINQMTFAFGSSTALKRELQIGWDIFKPLFKSSTVFASMQCNAMHHILLTRVRVGKILSDGFTMVANSTHLVETMKIVLFCILWHFTNLFALIFTTLHYHF